MLAHVGEPQRARVVDQQAEDAAAAGQGADRLVGLAVEAAGDELLEFAATVIEDPDSAVLRIGEPARHLQHPIEQDIQVSLRDEASPHLHQAAETVLREL